MEDFTSLPMEVKYLLKKLVLQNKKLTQDNRELRRKVREISLLYDMIRILNESSDRQQFYHAILEMALKISNSEAGCIFLTNLDKQRLVLQAAGGQVDPFIIKWIENLPKDIEKIILQGEVTELVHSEPLLVELKRRDPLIKSALFFPLIFNREKFGLGLVMHRHQEFVCHSIHYAEDLRFLSILAQQASLVSELNRIKFDKQSDQIYLKTIAALTEAIDAKDVYTAGHSQRVAEISTTIAYELGLTQKEIDNIHYGALLHDIGKIGIPEVILNKKGRLTDDEFFAIKRHPIIGTNILRSIDFLDDALNIVRYHHERFDGRGYPDGISGEHIPFMARIVGVADSWDAMTSNRSYRKALPFSIAIEELEKNTGTQFDPLIINALQKGSFAQLKTI